MTLITDAAKASVKHCMPSLGAFGRSTTMRPPTAVALPATAALKTGWKRDALAGALTMASGGGGDADALTAALNAAVSADVLSATYRELAGGR
jgi:hypothetical protein